MKLCGGKAFLLCNWLGLAPLVLIQVKRCMLVIAKESTHTSCLFSHVLAFAIPLGTHNRSDEDTDPEESFFSFLLHQFLAWSCSLVSHLCHHMKTIVAVMEMGRGSSKGVQDPFSRCFHSALIKMLVLCFCLLINRLGRLDC